MKAAQEHLQSVAYRLSEALYKTANTDVPGNDGSGEGPAAGAADDDDVIDAEEVSAGDKA